MLLMYAPRIAKSISLASTKTSKPDNSAPVPATKQLPPSAFDKLYWFRIGSAVVAAAATEGLYILYATGWTIGVSIGIGAFLVTYYVALFTWYRGIPREQQGKVYTTGIGGFTMVFLFTWMLLFTLRVLGFPL